MDDPFAELRPKLDGALEVYVSNWCWDCRRLKNFLAEHSVPHALVNVNDDAEAGRRLVAETGKRGVPSVLVRGNKWVRGYHIEKRGNFDPTLFIADLARAL